MTTLKKSTSLLFAALVLSSTLLVGCQEDTLEPTSQDKGLYAGTPEKDKLKTPPS